MAGIDLACCNIALMLTGKARAARLLFRRYSRVFKLQHGAASLLALAVACSLSAQPQQQGNGAASLAGTEWELVRFQGGDGIVVTPPDSSKYTVRFDADGSVVVRLDCNRGRATWKSAGPGQVTLGGLALTRALCPQPSMHDTVVKQWNYIRSWVIRDQRLFLSLTADGGAFEFRPAAVDADPLRSPVSSTGPVGFRCNGGESFRATFYETQPGMVLIERGDGTRPAFQVRSGSGVWYVGDSVQFREARGEATLEWAGKKLTCKAR